LKEYFYDISVNKNYTSVHY